MVMAKCMQDRTLQILGNEPLYVRMLDDRGENPAGFGVQTSHEKYSKIVQADEEIAHGHVNRTTRDED